MKHELTKERTEELRAFEQEIGHHYTDLSLLDTALTHSSYAKDRGNNYKYNERLEFLGDSVLGFVTAEAFFEQFSDLPEGKLTKLRSALVCEDSLYSFAQELHLGDRLLLGKSELHNGGRERPSILADAFEAVIASIYLDAGMEDARKFVLRFVMPIVSTHNVNFKDYKTQLQEIVQKNPEESVSYHLVGSSGPDHNPVFEVEVHLNSNVIGRGKGHTKKAAEQAAAKEALALMGL